MGYVGNQTTNSYSSMDKQTITGNGGASYTLTHAVANAQEIEVFVNNVRQEAGIAYTVSGTALSMTGNVASTDDFYVIYQGKALQTVVPPDGSVTSAKLAGDAVTTAKIQDGAVSEAKMFSTFSNGITEIDLYRLTADFSTNASTMTGWERPDDGHFAKLGTGMSEASGIFTFPSTGLWRIDGHWQLLCAANDSVVVHVSVSQDSGSNYDVITLGVDGAGTGGSTGSASTTNLINVTNAGTFRIKFIAQSINSGSSFKGDTNFNETHVVFQRIADAQ